MSVAAVDSNVISLRPLNVQLDTFEGPLSLLLYLIRKDELDIYNIPIHTITKQYLEYIQIMKELNLEVAGEFVAMAATLIYIKSRMLVPQYNENGEEVQDDPRKELVQKLLEYQKYQEAGKQLYKRPLLGRDIWIRTTKTDLDDLLSGTQAGSSDGLADIIVDERGLFGLISAFRQLQKKAADKPHTVKAKGLSIASRILEIKDKFKLGERIVLEELLSSQFTRSELLITFLSLLELSRLGYTRIYQLEPLAPIYIETMKTVSSDEIDKRVQEFDSAQAAAAADKIMADAQAELEITTMQNQAESQIDISSLETDRDILAVESGELE